MTFLKVFFISLLAATQISWSSSILQRHTEKGDDLAALYPQRFEALYKNVSKNWSKDELKQLLSLKKVSEIDDQTERNLRFILSPVSVKKQREQHQDFIPKLVNEKTIAQGVEFFEKYKLTLKKAYDTKKVHPADIIAVLNWESKLGTMVGEQRIIQIFIGQYFLAEKYEEALFNEGAYKKEGAMSREAALKRIARLRGRALGNLSALLNQAVIKKYDPVEIKGSWAGAIGFPQFMPASMTYAEDGDGDGEIDLFNMHDAIMSVANYLFRHHYSSKGREHSFRRYNPEEIYVKGVRMYGDMAREAGIGFDQK
jgi:membrane-bound lytic murein transglycosylase B